MEDSKTKKMAQQQGTGHRRRPLHIIQVDPATNRLTPTWASNTVEQASDHVKGLAAPVMGETGFSQQQQQQQQQHQHQHQHRHQRHQQQLPFHPAQWQPLGPASTVAMTSSLVPMMDHRPQQQQQQQYPPPLYQDPSMMHYPGSSQSVMPPLPPANAPLNAAQAAGFPLTADARMRQKKEIKRRTKTGCLTCRKRRIKCDETHPVCRNCQKSKRECLGYDPIFKAQPGPAPIQPAPNSVPALQSASSSAPSPYPAPPSGYMQAAAQPYPHIVSTGPAMAPAVPAPYDFSAAIDPALEAAGAAQVPANSLYDGSQDGRLGASPTRIEELLNVGSGLPPPPIAVPASVPQSTKDEVRNLYQQVYAPGIDKFFETRWFSTHSYHYLFANDHLCEKYGALISRFNITANTHYRENLITQSLEAHILWDTFLLARQASAAILATGSLNSPEINAGVHDAAKRVELYEALVTNQYIDPSRLEPGPDPKDAAGRSNGGNAFEDQLKERERDFWRLVGHFLTLRDSDAPRELDGCLQSMRGLLDSRENRDVLYSIAIARHVGQRMAENAKLNGTGAEGEEVSNNEADERAKLKVARDFISGEAAGKGTTQCVQRVCGMVVRSWGAR